MTQHGSHNLVLISAGGTVEEVAFERITRIELRPAGLRAANILNRGVSYSSRGERARRVLADSSLGRPERRTGEPLAALTARLEITYSDRDGQERSHTFDVIADALLRDPQSGAAYRLGQGLKDALALTFA